MAPEPAPRRSGHDSPALAALDLGSPHRRITWALGLSLALWLALGGGITALALQTSHGRASASHAGHARLVFNHAYPQDPVPFERPAVGVITPSVPPSQRVRQGVTIRSVASLAALLPTGSLRPLGPGSWRIARPVELPARTALILSGPLRLELAPGAFVIAEHGARLALTGVTVVGVGPTGRPESAPRTGRGFLAARSGALLQLHHDVFCDLGYLGDQTYGITADGASSGFSLTHSTVIGDFFGVYLARMGGGTVEDNRFVRSDVYGIDPHTYDTHLRIVGNVVARSGLHGIVLADHASSNLIESNLVVGSRDHGIVLVQSSDNNLIRDNVVRDTFDGIVVSSSSYNRVLDNVVGPSGRFGLRLSGSSTGNLVESNRFFGALLGAYLYRGATANQLLSNVFVHDQENVRVRRDATANVVSPNPGRSEL